MLLSIIIAIVGLLGAIVALRQILRADPNRLDIVLRKGGALVAGLIALLLLINGRILLGGLLAGFAWALWTDRIPFVKHDPQRAIGAASHRRRSNVRTGFFEMSLDHRNRAVEGRVLAGAFAGRTLESLSRSELLQLYGECRAGEPQSRQLLEAYLDRFWAGWRDDLRRNHGKSAGNGRTKGSEAHGTMKREEAWEVLGLAPGASDEAIRTAHRSLMKRFHPDQGGSTYLAAKINEAKDVLLGKRG